MKKVFTFSLICLLILFCLPLFLHAQGAPTATKIIQNGLKILNLLVSFAIGLSLVIFLFALVKYVTAGSGEEKAAARGLMVYGIIALFVAVSVWGLVRFIQSEIGINGDEQVSPPSLPTY